MTRNLTADVPYEQTSQTASFSVAPILTAPSPNENRAFDERTSKTPELNRPFSCEICLKRFTRSENLKRHTKQHSLLRFICPYCEKGYSRNDSLKTHIRRIHSKASQGKSRKGSSKLASQPNNRAVTASCILKERTNADMTLRTDSSSSNNLDHSDAELEEPEDYQDSRIPLNNVSKDEIQCILDLYWLNFDPSFPILHKRSFKMPLDYSTDILVNVLCSIGLRYVKDYTGAKKIVANEIYSYCIEQLENALNSDFTIIYFQAALIAIYAGLFSGNDDWYKWSINNHFQLVSMARENGMFQYNASLKVTDEDWNMFILTETRKRISYALYFIDGQMVTLLNYPPKLSHYEIKHILPCSDTLWNAENYESWKYIFQNETLHNNQEAAYFLDGLQQILIHGDVPKPISAFGGVVVLLAIHIMIRNMAQYSGILDQRQPTSQDPFSRRSQLGQALNGLRGLIPKKSNHIVSKDVEGGQDGALKSMWDFFEANWNLAYIHLHLPDTAITSGIVEVTLDTTIATAAALSKPQLDLLPGTVLLSNDYTQIPYETYALVNSHILFFLKNFKHQFKETNPALTFMFYKGCLVAWQILKASSTATSMLSMLSKNELLISSKCQVTGKSFPPSMMISNLEMKKEILQKEYMMKRLADDILSHIDDGALSNIGLDDTDLESFAFFNKWVETLLYSYDIWGIGKCASVSFTEMLSTSDDHVPYTPMNNKAS